MAMPAGRREQQNGTKHYINRTKPLEHLKISLQHKKGKERRGGWNSLEKEGLIWWDGEKGGVG